MEIDTATQKRQLPEGENAADEPPAKRARTHVTHVVPSLFPITVIGSFPKPSSVKIPTWFDGNANKTSGQANYVSSQYDEYKSQVSTEEHESSLQTGVQEIVQHQTNNGVDVITDGEIARENYIFYQCRELNGIDFQNLTERALRDGNYTQKCPTLNGKISRRRPASDDGKEEEQMASPLIKDWLRAQTRTDRPVKVTLPGPMTIMGTIANSFYENDEAACRDLAVALNEEILDLVKCGVKYIQVDEPLFARKVDDAIAFGFDCLKKCFEGVPADVVKCCHICCGYTNTADDEGYVKAESHSYVRLAQNGLDDLGLDAVSVEDAHTRVPIELFPLLRKTKIILGCMRSCVSEVFEPQVIVDRVEQVIKEGGVPKENIILSPDCGLAMFTTEIAVQKLACLSTARDLLVAKFKDAGGSE